MVFLIQPLMKYVDGHVEVNTPVTKTLQDVCSSSSSDASCSCMTGQITDWTSKLFNAPKQHKEKKSKDDGSSGPEAKEVENLFHIQELYLAHIKKFSDQELRVATNDFSEENKVGRGGFGSVYKGTLADGRIMAVKRLAEFSYYGEMQFRKELHVSSIALHRNLLPLYGYSNTGQERLLVYPFVANGDLASHLKKGSLDWTTRKNIALGVARGLAHMHEYCHTRVIHRDIKPGNILLNDKFEPLVMDFGLATPIGNDPFTAGPEGNTASKTKFNCVSDFVTHVSTCIVGTVGYLAPEYVLCGRCSEKCDVYAFGVTILQLVSGITRAYEAKANHFDDEYLLVYWVKKLLENKEMHKLVDTKLHGEFVKEELDQMIKVGLLCTSDCHRKRPQMSEVIRMLEGTTTMPPEWENIQQELQCMDKDICCYWSELVVAATGSSTNLHTQSLTLTNIALDERSY